MSPQNRRLLNLECNGEIIHMFVSEAEFTRASTDSLFAQELFDRHTQRYSVSITNENELPFAKDLNTENIAEITQENEEITGESSGSLDSLWSEAETLLFISLYDNHKEEFSHAKKRKHVWAIIAEEMTAHGYFREIDKLERKWTNLMRVYRAIKDNKGPKKTGRGAQNYKYFEKIEEIVGEKPSNNPSSATILDVGVNSTALPASNNDISMEENNESSTLDESSEVENTCPNPKKRRVNHSLALKKQKMEQREARHKELVALEQRRLRIEERKVELLEKYLERETGKK